MKFGKSIVYEQKARGIRKGVKIKNTNAIFMRFIEFGGGTKVF